MERIRHSPLSLRFVYFIHSSILNVYANVRNIHETVDGTKIQTTIGKFKSPGVRRGYFYFWDRH